MTGLRLYDYGSSSAAYRVRIALALKGLKYDKVSIDLLGGDQFAPEYQRINPQALVPALETEHGIITQSLAIIEYLEERHPEPPLLPHGRGDRARARAMALAIAAEIHPLQNLRVRTYLRDAYHQPPDAVTAWLRHWIEVGLKAFQDMRAVRDARYCLSDQVSLPDVLLVPQMVNARRYGCDFAALAALVEIDARLRELPAFRDAALPQP